MTQITNHRGQGVWNAPSVWLGGERLDLDIDLDVSRGVVRSVSARSAESSADPLAGVVLPGLVNAHSHAFHRLLRGGTHRQGGDFWLWRESMYEEAGALTPETYEEIATAVYIEMALAGVTTVGEFHYVHHQPGGVPYDDSNEMGHALIRAARRAGIRICLLDAGYFRSGFADEPLHPVQERFRDPSVEAWLERVEALTAAYFGDPDVVVGLAPHSVRAVSPEGLKRTGQLKDDSAPLHIHVSEQPAENEECLEATGRTPAGLLADSGLLGPMTTLVHATHLTREDIAAIGASGSRVCYCATTERDLADGLGPASDLVAAGAGLSVGSDSHAVIDIFEEARGVEMHQRLRTGRRGVMDPGRLLDAATSGGARALGWATTGLAVGAPADMIVIDPESPRLIGVDSTSVDSIVFAATAADVTDTFVGGERIVTDRHHPAWEAASRALSLHGR